MHRELASKSTRELQLKSRVLQVVATIPEGRVTTYGTIARYLHTTARHVGMVMASLTANESRRVPWFRVVAANGVVSTIKLGSVGRRQIARLRAEGLAVTARNKVEDFNAVAWFPGRTTWPLHR
jgi:methylated-DNA-protein-cysteine methyltransferase-like protein